MLARKVYGSTYQIHLNDMQASDLLVSVKGRDRIIPLLCCKQSVTVGRVRSPEMEDSGQSKVQFQQGLSGGGCRWKEDTYGGDTQCLELISAIHYMISVKNI